MQAIATHYKLLKKIKDERFEEDNIHQYALLINIGTRDLQIGVVDEEENRFLFLEDYVIPNVKSAEDLLEVLKVLFDAHAFLRAGFWKKIKVSFKNQKFIQVPDALFIPEALPDYLKFNAHINEDKEDLSFTHSESTKAVTVFATYKDIKEWIRGLYPGKEVKFTHQSAALIEALVYAAKKLKQQDNPLYIYIDRFKLHILSWHKNKLIYYNQFPIQQFADYIKYIMLVMKSLNMNQHTSKVLLWGYIGKNSPHYHEFYKYINNVEFGARPDYLKYSYFFDEVQDHHFLDLYGIHLID